MEDLKKRIREIVKTAERLDAGHYMEQMRPVFEDVLTRFGLDALLAVNSVILDAYTLREDPDAQKKVVAGGLVKLEKSKIEPVRVAKPEGIAAMVEWGTKYLDGKITSWREVFNERIANELTRPFDELELISHNTFTKQYSLTHNKCTLSAKSQEMLQGFGDTVGQVMDFLMAMAIRSGSCKGFTFTLSDFLKERGLTARITARQQLQNAFDKLYNVSISYDTSELRKKAKKAKLSKLEEIYLNLGEFRILQNLPRIPKRGAIPVVFGELYRPVLECSVLTPWHDVLMKVNTRINPYSYTLGRKTFIHKHIEARKRKDGVAEDAMTAENVLTVKTLMKWVGLKRFDSPSIPSDCKDPDKYLKTFRKNYRQKVIQPFERDMDRLSDAFTWEYVLNGKPVRREDVSPVNFSDMSVFFHFKDYPKQVSKMLRSQRLSLPEA